MPLLAVFIKPTCPYCRELQPVINQLHQTMSPLFTMYNVAEDPTLFYEVLVPKLRATGQLTGTPTVPMIVAFDSSKRPVRYTGKRDYASIVRFFRFIS